MKEIDSGCGCVLMVVAIGLAALLLFHGAEIAAHLLGGACS